ncbi:DNA polymerase III subunit gamma/tau [Amedibacillus sp. YH-ame6]
MGYKALYRTYRPNSFEEVAGQKHVVQTLQNAVEQNKIAHAYLFSGPRGTGKTSIAKIFAKTINCENEEVKPCLKCDNCLSVQEGSHPDIIEIDAASNNGVEEVRTLIEKVKYAPLKGKYKVYIIDEVHMMSTGAFNALLKTIEEPPAHVIFILATTEPHKVLPTIISRCQRFDFTKVSRPEIVERIHTVLKAENIQCDEDVIKLIAQLADGGLRDALSILDQCIAYAKDHVELHHINEIYGITTVQEKLELFHSIFNKEPVVLLDKVDDFIEKGVDIKRLTEDLIELLKESIIFEYTKDASLLHDLSNEEASMIIKGCTIKTQFKMIDLLMGAYDKYRFAANVGSYFEVCLLEMLDVSTTNTTEKVVAEPVITKKEPVKEIPQPQNVSRETFEATNTTEEVDIPMIIEEVKPEPVAQVAKQESKPATEVIPSTSKIMKSLDNDFVLGLLVGATKPEKAYDMDKFSTISDYLVDLKWARFASLLRNATIVGSGNNYIVIGVDSKAEANEINEVDSNNEFQEFIVELLGKNKKIFGISKAQQNVVIQEFKDRMINGTLPEPLKIEDVAVEDKTVVEPTQEETILSLFGEENITITEE